MYNQGNIEKALPGPEVGMPFREPAVGASWQDNQPNPPRLPWWAGCSWNRKSRICRKGDGKSVIIKMKVSWVISQEIKAGGTTVNLLVLLERRLFFIDWFYQKGGKDAGYKPVP
jgi:hypothetical protein